MKRFRKVLAAALSALVAVTAACGGFSVKAAVTVSDGTFVYIYSDNEWQLYQYVGSDTEVVLPASFDNLPVTSVADECFSGSAITKATIPDGYISVGRYVFYNCTALSEVRFPSSLLQIGMGAFASSGLQSADLSGTQLVSLPPYLFMNCLSLESAILPATLQTIGNSAFLNSGLQEIILPEGVTSVGESCFADSALRSAELPESLETIGASAFRNDTALTELYLPESVSDIGGYALFPMSVQGNVRVTCFEGTYADQYCYENFVNNTIAYQKLFGDADLDGTVTINDVTAVQRFCSELDAPSRPARILSDVQRDNSINIGDATLIQRYLAEFEDAVLG